MVAPWAGLSCAILAKGPWTATGHTFPARSPTRSRKPLDFRAPGPLPEYLLCSPRPVATVGPESSPPGHRAVGPARPPGPSGAKGLFEWVPLKTYGFLLLSEHAKVLFPSLHI